MVFNDYSTISELELIAARAWPARREKELNGWVLRSHDGVTARANSVLPYTTQTVFDFDTMITAAIRFYEEQGYPPMFKMTNACRPVGLDKLLDKLDFKIEMHTHFQIAELKNLVSLSHNVEVQIDRELSLEWFEAYTQISGFSERAMSARKGIITDIKLEKAVASVRINGSIVGIGLGVLYNNWVGFFSVGTDSQHRRKGIGISVNQALAVWAEDLGAEKAYLQVEVDNFPAIALYKDMGFKTLYNYWYRVRRD